MIESDDQLVQRARRGDREAFSSLVRRYERPARAAAWNVLHSWHDAGDVSQEAFVVAYEKLHRLWSPRKFGAWLLRITYRLALNNLRQRQRRAAETLDPDMPERPAAPKLSETSLDLVALLDRLPMQERVVVSLRYLDGLSLAEVAQVTGRPTGTVGKQLSRAYARLRYRLNGKVNHA